MIDDPVSAASAVPAQAPRLQPGAAARELSGALAGSIASLVVVITLGVLAFGGAGGAAVGIPAGFAAIVFGGLTVALLSRSSMPAAGPTSASALILAGLVSQLASDPALTSGPSGVRPLLALTGAAVMLMGVLQFVLGGLRAGSMAKFVPQPVLAGFMNGIAVLILFAQVPVLLGIPAAIWNADHLASLALAQPATLAVGLVTAAVVWIVAARSRRVPSTLVGLVVGCLFYAAVHRLMPSVALGPLAADVPGTLPLPTALAPLVGGMDLPWRHVQSVLTAAVILALVGSLETILNMMAVDQQLHEWQDPNRELVVFGIGNVVSGAFGGLPVVFLRMRATVTLAAGGRSRWSMVAGCLLLGAVFLAAAPLMGLLPLTVLAGVMVTIAAGLADRWTHRLVTRWARGGDRSRDLRASLVVVAAVCVVTFALGFVAGVAVGMLLSVVMFIRAMNRSLVRTRYTAAMRPSRRLYPSAQEDLLRPARARIHVLELEGALFFGSASRLGEEVEALDRPSHVILDFNRVSNIDPSGAMALAQLHRRLTASGTILALAGVSGSNRHGLTLEAFDSFGGGEADWYLDGDRAIEAAERSVLAAAGQSLDATEVSIEHSLFLQDLAPEQVARVRARMRVHDVRAGEWIFHEGDPGTGLFVLTAGSISIVAGDTRLGAAGKRFLSFSPGMMFGELAMLDGRGRTAGALADVDSVVHELPRDELLALRRTDPETAALIYANIARHLSERLRTAAYAWRADAA